MTQHFSESDAPRGIFITFEGGDGAGKTTHIRFLSEKLRERGREVVCLREPGGTAVGEELRAVVLDPKNENLADEAELLIYEAARAQIVAEVIRPALERGAVVLCDRFADSTVAYQVHGRGLDADFVERANAFACQGTVPHRTILMVTGGSAKTGLARATHRNGADRLELAGEEFHTRVNEGFLALARDHADRVRVVQSASKKSKTSARVFRELADLFPWMADVLDDEKFFAPLDVRRPRPQGAGSGNRASGGKGRGASKGARSGSGGRGARGNGSGGSRNASKGPDGGRAAAPDGPHGGRRGK
ncbi:dTMP kinase [Gordonibacter sp. 28C]|uniref:dTMP kinase n=1 Tax=Gordonibacter sp. 28C TaxID=2078569 RepID=UPI0018F720A4|nr:dTMP kinase [Gordonibacter sp. 28C]